MRVKITVVSKRVYDTGEDKKGVTFTTRGYGWKDPFFFIANSQIQDWRVLQWENQKAFEFTIPYWLWLKVKGKFNEMMEGHYKKEKI